MKRILIALALLGLAAAPALAQTGSPKTKTQMNTEINTQFPDNTTGAITPAILRQVTLDMVASWQQFPSVNAQTAASYTIQASDYGSLVTVSNAGAIAVTLPQATGSFQTFAFTLKNVGATTATITPVTSTINGAASLSVTAGNAFYIVSDGANWQAVSFGGSGSIPDPLFVSTVIGGTGAGSSLTLRSTNSGSPSGDKITFATGANVARQTILGNGNIGFGTETNPQSKFIFSTNATTSATLPNLTANNFQIIGTDGQNSSQVLAAFGGIPIFTFAKANGGLGSGLTNVIADDILGQFGFSGYSQSAAQFTTARAQIKGQALNTWSASDNSTYLAFLTTPGASTSIGQVGRFMQGLVVGTGTTDPGIGNIQATGLTLSGITGATPQCLHVNTVGLVSGTGADCGSGGGGGTPGGSNTQVQYNNSGVFGGITGVTTNGSNLVFPDTATWSTTGLNNTGSYSTVSTPTLTWSPTWTFSSAANGISPIAISPTMVPTSGTTAGNFGAAAFQGFLGTSAVNVGNVRTASFVTTVNAGYTGTASTANAISLNVGNLGTNPVTTMSGIANNIGNNGVGITSGTVTNILYDTGINANAPGAGGTINNYAYRVTMPSGSGAGTTNNRGIYITGNGGTGGAGATNNFALFSDSTAPSSLAGSLAANGLTVSNITGSTQCLQVNTSGVVSGSGGACGGGGGTPGGSNTQIQYNNAGAFGGISGVTTNGTNLNILAGSTLAVVGTENVTGTFQVNGNTMTFPGGVATIPAMIANGATTLATAAIASGTCATTQTVSAPGVATSDAITVSFNNDYTGTTGYTPATTGGLTIFTFPTANNVNFHVCNNTLASITPGAVTLNWRVIR